MVPALLAYKEGKQGTDGVVPDGYKTHIVWEMVSGKPLDTDQFWKPESARLREAVRTKFRHIWECVYRIPSSVLRVRLTNLRELKPTTLPSAASSLPGWYQNPTTSGCVIVPYSASANPPTPIEPAVF